MAAHVDIHNCVIREGDAVWPFDVDCREDVAEVVIDDRRYKLHPLGWREKRNLARYVQLGEGFLQTQFLRVSLHSSATDLPASAQHREVLSALARWLNAPDGSFGLPLDRKFLTSVTLDLCRSMQLTPAAFDALAAAEVELLWQSDRARNAPPVTAPTTSDIANNAPGLTRIVVLPENGKKTTDKGADKSTGAAVLSSGDPLESAPVAELNIPVEISPDSATTIGSSLNRSATSAVGDTPGGAPIPVFGDTSNSASARELIGGVAPTNLMPLKKSVVASNRFRVELSGAQSAVATKPVNINRNMSTPAPEIAVAVAPNAEIFIAPERTAAETIFSSSTPAACVPTMANRHFGHVLAFDTTSEEMSVAAPASRPGVSADEQWLTLFAERLDEAALASGIDLEN